MVLMKDKSFDEFLDEHSTLLIAAAFTIFFIVVVFSYSNYTLRGGHSDIVCERMLNGTRFKQCEQEVVGQVKVCQDWGSSDYRNDSMRFKYCEDYQYDVINNTIEFKRVR